MASVVSHSRLQPRRRHQLREFHHRTKMLLTEMERHHLFAMVKEFQLERHLDRFLRDLSHVLDTPTKLDLLKDIRYFIPASLAIQYNRLAPYHQMAHPLNISTKSLGRYGGKKFPSVSMQSSPVSMRHPLGMTDAPASDPAPLKVITLVKDTDEQLGFSIRGGSEYGLGIFISDVEEESAAEHAGLRMGDNIIEVNSVSFQNIASSSAVKVLIGCNRLRILVRRVGKVPGFKSAKEKTSWFDVVQNRIVTGTLEEHGKFHSTAAIAHINGHVNRRINLTCRREGEYLGFNIRGGREYALGIYVSGVDPDGIAEQKGLKVGDQIIAVNGHSFEEVSHMEAVEVMKSDKQLVMTVRDVGIYPVYKEIYAEYRWIDVVTGAVTKSRTTGHITSVPVTEHSPLTTPDPPSRFQAEHASSFMGSEDERDIANFVDDENDMFDESNAMELFNQQHKQVDTPSQTEIYASINSVLQPMKDDVIMQERHLEASAESNGNKPNIVAKSKSPKSTIAVRAMENETRRNHPELSSLWENEKVCDSVSNEKSIVHKKAGRKSRTIRELIFGTKSKGTSGKSATEGAHRKPRIRKALSGINFKLGSSKDTDSVKQGSETSTTSKNGSFLQMTTKSDLSPTLVAVMKAPFKPFRSLFLQLCIEEDRGISHDTEAAAIQQTDSDRMVALKHSASRLLNTDEVSAVVRHITTYKEAGGVDGLVTPLTAILDTSQKTSLFDEIRMILSAKDVGQFDSLVARHRSALSTGRGSAQPLDVMMTARGHDVSNELCRINRKCLLSPVGAREQLDIGAATGNPCYPHRNSKLYKAVIHDKVKGQPRGVKESIQEKASVEKSDLNMGNDHDMFRHHELWEERIPEEPEELEADLSSSVTNTSPVDVASVSHQVSSAVCSSPVNGGVRLVREIATIENGYIDDFVMSPVYETIGAPKVQPVSLMVTPPCNNNDSGTHNGTGDCGTLDEVNAALNYIDSLDTEGSMGYQSNDDIDYSAPGSPRSIDSDVTTFGRRSATYDLAAVDNTGRSMSNNKGYSPGNNEGLGDNEGYSPCDKGYSLGDNEGYSPGDNEGYSLGNNEGYSCNLGDNSVSSPAAEDRNESDLLRHPPPLFIPPPPPSESLPLEEGSREEGETDGANGGIQEDNSDTSGDLSPSQGNTHFSDTMPVRGKVSINGDDALVVECDSDTESISTSGQFDLPSNTDLDDTDQTFIILLDKCHRSLGISISGGSDSRSQPQVKIQKVFPGGAADIEGTIKSGMSVLSVDGHSMEDVSHQDAVTFIRRSYMDKTDPIFKLVLMKD